MLHETLNQDSCRIKSLFTFKIIYKGNVQKQSTDALTATELKSHDGDSCLFQIL